MLDRNRLINQTTGEFDWTFIKQQALLRADHEFGGPGAPNSYVRDALKHYQDLARDMQYEWRKAHGLPVTTVLVSIPAWGASGDSFARAR